MGQLAFYNTKLQSFMEMTEKENLPDLWDHGIPQGVEEVDQPNC